MQMLTQEKPNSDKTAQSSDILVDLVIRRHLEPRFKQEILGAIQGLPMEARTVRFIEALDWFFGSRRFGYILIRDLLDQLLPGRDEFLKAFNALCARVVENSFRSLDDLLGSLAGNDSPHNKVLKLWLCRREDRPWSALLTAIQAHAEWQVKWGAEPFKPSRTPSLEMLYHAYATWVRRQKLWSIHQLQLSPAGQKFCSRLQEVIYIHQENCICKQLQDTPKCQARRERNGNSPTYEETVAEYVEQAEAFEKARQKLFGPAQEVTRVAQEIIEQVCPEEIAARECCADLVLLFVWCGLLNAQSPRWTENRKGT